jgi:hypothetical protein
VVEDCLCLDISDLVRSGTLREEQWGGTWDLRKDGRQTGILINYEIDQAEPDQRFITLTYTFSATNRNYRYGIQLEATLPRFGGHRWWFRCPMRLDDGLCGQRISKLYLPSGDPFFGCRSCHKLTYRSSQSYDKRVRESGPFGQELEIILAHMNEPGWLEQNLGKVSVALKAKE